ncbi:MAG: hypothetical protein GF375_02605, partial [Candidatus Omnitrophica bacterium]|nr:hypothetical protein [Candidatus Omnitrophota bacterium]MBD3268992.1 hypothetical protein [Candidatus Omnitrophota bacterium]
MIKIVSLSKKIFHRLPLVILGVFLALLLLEGVLRFGEHLFFLSQERRNAPSFSLEKPYRIICLGGSTTANGGDFSYPRQLENILNANSGSINFEVLNKGIPGATSALILSRLE